MGIGDLFQIDLVGNIAGSLGVNVFHYRADTGDVYSVDVALAFDTQILPSIAAIESPEKDYDKISVKNLFDVVDDFEMAPTTTVGAWPGEDMGSHSAAPFVLTSPNRAIRNGAKRFGPVGETAATNGIIDGAGYITAMSALADLLDDQVLVKTGEYVSPVIIQRIKYLPEGSEDYAYRLPANAGEAISGNILSVVPQYRVSTQNSRKSWVGD